MGFGIGWCQGIENNISLIWSLGDFRSNIAKQTCLCVRWHLIQFSKSRWFHKTWPRSFTAGTKPESYTCAQSVAKRLFAFLTFALPRRKAHESEAWNIKWVVISWLHKWRLNTRDGINNAQSLTYLCKGNCFSSPKPHWYGKRCQTDSRNGISAG